MKRRRQKQIKGPRARHITEIPTQLLRPYKGCCGNWLCGYKICKDRRACSHQVVVQYLNMFFFELLLLFMVCYTRGEACGVPFKTTDSHTWTGTKFRQMFKMFLCYFYYLYYGFVIYLTTKIWQVAFVVGSVFLFICSIIQKLLLDLHEMFLHQVLLGPHIQNIWKRFLLFQMEQNCIISSQLLQICY